MVCVHADRTLSAGTHFKPVFDNVLLVALFAVPCTFISAYLTIYLLRKLPFSKYLY